MSAAQLDPQITPTDPLAATLSPEEEPLEVAAHGVTHAGRVRPANEDQFLLAEMTKSLRVLRSSLAGRRTRWGDERGYLFVVADGMGGHRAGEQASALALLTIEDFMLNTFKWFFHLRGNESQTVLRDFQAALRQADLRVFEEAVRNPELRGMGTTLTMAYAVGRDLFVAHVGDSRAYLLRGDELTQLTHDHTLAEEMVRRGQLTPEQAAGSRLSHIITNAIGGPETGVRAELHKVRLEVGDRLLLCSDGLSGEVADERLAAVLREEADPEPACERLLAEALEHGGRDNITVLVARFH
jgi:protein phosphatase